MYVSVHVCLRMCRAGQNHKYTPYIAVHPCAEHHTYTAYIYGSGQPYVCALRVHTKHHMHMPAHLTHFIALG